MSPVLIFLPALPTDTVIRFIKTCKLIQFFFFQMPMKFVFVLNYGHIEHFLRQTGQLHRAATLPAKEQNCMVSIVLKL